MFRLQWVILAQQNQKLAVKSFCGLEKLDSPRRGAPAYPLHFHCRAKPDQSKHSSYSVHAGWQLACSLAFACCGLSELLHHTLTGGDSNNRQVCWGPHFGSDWSIIRSKFYSWYFMTKYLQNYRNSHRSQLYFVFSANKQLHLETLNALYNFFHICSSSPQHL